MTTNSVTLHRVFKANPNKIFKAFSNPVAMASWIPPYGFICEVHTFDFKIDGVFKMSFFNFTTQKSNVFGGKYLDIKINEYLKYNHSFENPNLPGEMITSVSFGKVSCGTELKIVQEGIPKMIPTELCYLGWQESLEKLKNLVESEINVE